ncbi:MAG: hypothetical protein HY791_00855 [Deltaproteobacteria bacterium]|nr:hypothetical protein [Deltaproteobacteria bacterium]
MQDFVAESVKRWARLANVESSLGWLSDVYSMVDRKQIGAAKKLIDERFDRMLARQDFAGADSVLRAIDAKKLDASVILAALAATRRERANLPHRTNLLGRVIESRTWEREPNEATILLRSEVLEELAAVWREEIRHESSATKITEHPAYLQIISLGKSVVPSILERMRSGERHWGTALRKITGANPLKPSDAGRMAIQNERWIQWGKDQGLIR